MSTDEGFFARWSRRKAQARANPASAAAQDSERGAAQGQPTAPVPAEQPARSTTEAAAPVGATGPASAPPADPSPPPLPTLQDVQSLTPQSDFRPFVRPQVAPEVRNAALRKLFADPHFNVMDGLDVYIDDYSRPDPLPADLARRLVAAHAMRLFDDPARTAAPAPAAGAHPADAGVVEGDGAPTPAERGDAPLPEAPMPVVPAVATSTDTPSASDPVS